MFGLYMAILSVLLIGLSFSIVPQGYAICAEGVQCGDLRTIPPPLKQLKLGTNVNDVMCRDGFVLLLKSTNGNPTCVKPDTATKLITRGLAIYPTDGIPTNLSINENNHILNPNADCISITDIKKITKFNIKLPTYLPSNYVFMGCKAIPFEAQILYRNKNNFSNNDMSGTIDELISKGVVYLYVTDVKSILGKEFHRDIGDTDEFIKQSYYDAKKGNPSLDVDLIEINGKKAFVTKACETCGKQTVTFGNGNEITSTLPVPSKIKFFDKNGTKYYFQSNMPSSELIKIAKSLQ